MEKSFDELNTEEMAALTLEQQEEYAKIGNYTFEQIVQEVKECKKILDRMR